jgi:hypothetical protein
MLLFLQIIAGIILGFLIPQNLWLIPAHWFLP